MLAHAGCEAPPEPRPRPPETTTAWRPLGTWSGRGDLQTESFDVTTGALRLVWVTTGEATTGAGPLRVSLYSAISGRPLQTIVDTVGVGTDTVPFADEPRVSYLEVESDGVEWRLVLEEAVVAVGSR
ncbi:MAG: hypothetical protein FJ207_05630 [Gemmatimonadetes bacterium]|nr:hypothetical protein [Gemmatimonadota bacterium]